MFLLLTGASGVGKSTVRALLERELSTVRCAELSDLVPIPAYPDLAWRHRATESAVRYALDAQERGLGFLLAGDPVAPGEVLAAPSADRLDGFAACLLDCRADVQRRRLLGRGDSPATFDDHEAFADWLRGHVRNPQHRPEVITSSGWAAMRWERWHGLRAGDRRWRFCEIDTTELSPAQVAGDALDWSRRALERNLDCVD
jgi:hypothetical protein